MSSNLIGQKLPDFLSYIPLLTPAVDKQKYRVDFDLIIKRTITVVALAALALGAAVSISGSFLPLTFSCCVLFLQIFLVSNIDERKSQEAVDQLIVKDYLTQEHPSENVYYAIENNIKLAQAIINQKGNLNKISKGSHDFGYYLTLSDKNFEFFKLLVDNGFDWTKQQRIYGPPAFQKVESNEDPRFLKYLLKHGNIKVSDFTAEQQVRYLGFFENQEALSLLLEHGFDINIKNEDGFTPLLNQIDFAANETCMMLENGSEGMKVADRIRLLLSKNADPYMTVEKDGQQKNAFELNTNPEIASILNEYKAGTLVVESKNPPSIKINGKLITDPNLIGSEVKDPSTFPDPFDQAEQLTEKIVQEIKMPPDSIESFVLFVKGSSLWVVDFFNISKNMSLKNAISQKLDSTAYHYSEAKKEFVLKDFSIFYKTRDNKFGHVTNWEGCFSDDGPIGVSLDDAKPLFPAVLGTMEGVNVESAQKELDLLLK